MFGFALQFRVINRATFALFLVFIAALTFRFIYPFFDPPFGNWTGDSLRHWENAKFLFDKNRFMGGVDPKGFQFYLGGLYLIFKEHPLPYTIMAGLMSVGTAVFWLLTARELMPERRAIEAGISYAVLPSSFLIYSFFMNEQLLIFLLGLAWWLTLVWWRRRTSLIFFLAVMAWWAAILTRVVVLPIGLPIMILMILLSHRPLLNAFLAILVTIAFLLPAAKFTYDRTGAWSPFNFLPVNRIYALSMEQKIRFTFDNGTWYWFECPSFGSYPFYPLSTFQAQKAGEFNFHIKTNSPDRGLSDWYKTEHELREKFSWENHISRIKHNIIYTLFDYSWPESSIDPKSHIANQISAITRIIWAPLFIILFWGIFFSKLNLKQSLFYGATCIMILALFLQNQGVMEGRFRKPVEPMLILSVALLFSTSKHVQNGRNLFINALRFIKKTFFNLFPSKIKKCPSQPVK